VVRLLAVELLAAIVLFVLGVSPGDLLKSAGPVIALTIALLNPTVQELGRRQPRLTLVTLQASREGVIEAVALRPWPVDVDRVVANETAEARETISARGGAMDMLLSGVSDVFAARPSEADHGQARDAFERELSDFETSLRDWLSKYLTAARAHSQTFGLTLQLTNARGGAHAAAVTVVLNLPATISVAEEEQTVPLPPERPCYEPPRPRSLQANFPVGWAVMPRISPALLPVIPSTPFREPAWKVSNDSLRLETLVGEVHAGRSVGLGEPLLLLVDRAGQHEIRWTAYTKSARQPVQGTITLVVPPDRDRPGLGRLHGITSYPDVPIVNDDDGELVHPVRKTDPPLRPPAGKDSGDIHDRLQQAGALWEWKALGLDPASDGPDRSVVVHKARPVADGDQD
jgi:hypothetical protein